jgi:hypothetical protein
MFVEKEDFTLGLAPAVLGRLLSRCLDISLYNCFFLIATNSFVDVR